VQCLKVEQILRVPDRKERKDSAETCIHKVVGDVCDCLCGTRL
jgi:hypothetical protein